MMLAGNNAHVPPTPSGSVPTSGSPSDRFWHPFTLLFAKFRKHSTTAKRQYALSCSLEIQVARPRFRERAWLSRGPVMETFDRVIAPEIQKLLSNADLEDAQLYLRLYMIGKEPAKSRPVIMVCCTNSRARALAEQVIRDSAVLENYPDFGLYACAIPLEQPSPIVELMCGTGRGYPSHEGSKGCLEAAKLEKGNNPMNCDLNTVPPIGVAEKHTVGTRIQVFEPHQGHRYATGGVFICLNIGGGIGYYQLTVSHVIHPTTKHMVEPRELGECYIDNKKDDDAESVTAAPKRELDTNNGRIYLDRGTMKKLRGSSERFSINASPGQFELDSRKGPNPNLDYALLKVETSAGPLNEIVVRCTGGNYQCVRIESISDMPPDTREVYVITASSGVIPGRLSPSPMYFWNSALNKCQRFYSVITECPLFHGDSGAVVIDARSGCLFGHLVRGVPGSNVGYIVAATELFEDIRQRTSSSVSLVQADPLNYTNYWDSKASFITQPQDDLRSGSPKSSEIVLVSSSPPRPPSLSLESSRNRKQTQNNMPNEESLYNGTQKRKKNWLPLRVPQKNGGQ